MSTKSERSRLNNRLRQSLDSRRAALHMTKPNFAHRIGFSEDTYDRRYADPEKLTLGELRNLVMVMGWSAEDTADLLFGQK